MHTVVCGLGFGDEAKGATVDWLCETQPIDTIIRTGAAQAAHNVVRPDGRHHTFAQFGSGMFHPRVRTHHSRFMLVDPLRMHSEALALEAKGVEDPMGRTTIDSDCLIITPYHAAANRLRELARGTGRHGSCGIGVGETQAYALHSPESALRAGDLLLSQSSIAAKLATIRDGLLAEFPVEEFVWAPEIADVVASYRAFTHEVEITSADHTTNLIKGGSCVFEGSQGVLLDEWVGFHPYTTWSTTTFEPADTLLAEAGTEGFHLGVLRPYMTRHGAGPLPTEDEALLPHFPEAHNSTGQFQGSWRVGLFDSMLMRYATHVVDRIDGLALSHLDLMGDSPKRICAEYLDDDGDYIGAIPRNPNKTDLVAQEEITRFVQSAIPVYREEFGHWIDIVENELGIPVSVVANGPTSSHRSIFT